MQFTYNAVYEQLLAIMYHFEQSHGHSISTPTTAEAPTTAGLTAFRRNENMLRLGEPKNIPNPACPGTAGTAQHNTAHPNKGILGRMLLFF